MYESEIRESYSRVKDYVHRTPILTSRLINELAQAEVYFKCENFQKMGAFKMRGASNAILKIPETIRSRGVVTHSSGNMAQAVALSAKNLGIPAYIVMPDNAPQVKMNAVKDYGGIITICASTIEAREAASSEIAKNTGAIFLHPSNDLDVILGQGTAAFELLMDKPDLDSIIVPVGGGGLLAGTAIAANVLSKKCKVFAGEPREADDAYRSLISGQIEYNKTSYTIADGLRTHLGDINFPIIQKLVKGIVRVEEKEIINAMHMIYERLKIVIEPSSAVPLAALMNSVGKFKGQKVGIILTGGNVDLSKLPF